MIMFIQNQNRVFHGVERQPPLHRCGISRSPHLFFPLLGLLTHNSRAENLAGSSEGIGF